MNHYQVYYNSYLLDEIHNYFPAILYEPDTFRSVSDLMNYIQYQMRMRFDLFSAARRAYQPAAHGWAPQQHAWPPAGPQPAVGAATAGRHYMPPMAPVPPRPTVDELTVTMETLGGGLGGLGALLGLGGGGDAGAAATLLNQLFVAPIGRPTPIMEPVVVRPTAAQIDAGTTVEIVDAEEEVCAICQDTMEAGSEARNINACDHRFHITCIDTWFQRNVRCPVCRHDVREPPVDDSEDERVDSE